jgi:hypothetical protein
MKQVLFGYLNTVNFFNGIQGGMAVGTTIEANHVAPWPCTGVFRNLIVELVTAPGAGTRAFTLRINGVDSAMTLSMTSAGTVAQSTGVDVPVTAGDLVCLSQFATGTPSNSIARMSLEFEGTTAKESGYAQYLGPSANNAVARTTGAFSMHPTGAGAPPQTAQTLVAVDGVITKMYVSASANPGAGVGMTWYLNKNGVRQDGTAGTPNTGVALIGVTLASRTFSLAVAPNDLMMVEGVSTGTFAAVNWALSHNFIATTDLQSVLSGSSNSTMATQANMDVVIPLHTKNITQNGSHITAQYRMMAGINPVTLSGFRTWWQTGPGAAKTRRAFIEAGIDRLTGGAATGIVADLTGTGNFGSDLTHSYTTATGTLPDQLTVAFTNPLGSVLASTVSWGFIQTNPISVPTGPIASLTQTLANATISATATNATNAALARTLSTATLTSTVVASNTVTVTRTLTDATLSATLGSDTPRAAVVDQTLANATIIAIALPGRTTVAAQTLQNATSTATANAQDTATLSRTLDNATLNSAAGVLRAPSLTQTLANATITSTTTNEDHATLTRTLADATVTATALVYPVRQSALDQTLQPATVTATAIVIPVSGIVVVQTLANVTITATAVVVPISVGVVAQTLGAVTVNSTAGLTDTAALAQTLSAAALTASTSVEARAAIVRTLGAATLSSAAASQSHAISARTLADATLASLLTTAGTQQRQPMGTIA